jgi:isochorismate pyruvate lyase
MAVVECDNLAEVRARIDAVDRELVRVLAERAAYVRQAVRFKRDAAEAAAPARVEQVVANARRLAAAHGTDPDLVERVYRAMIAWFVAAETRTLERRG